MIRVMKSWYHQHHSSLRARALPVLQGSITPTAEFIRESAISYGMANCIPAKGVLARRAAEVHELWGCPESPRRNPFLRSTRCAALLCAAVPTQKLDELWINSVIADRVAPLVEKQGVALGPSAGIFVSTRAEVPRESAGGGNAGWARWRGGRLWERGRPTGASLLNSHWAEVGGDGVMPLFV